MSAPSTRAPRHTLSRDRVLTAARDQLDEGGLDALTMRSLATTLGVQPMSLYRHVSDKEELLDAVVARVYDEMVLSDPAAGDWRGELGRRSGSVRDVLLRHPWALPVLETRSGVARTTMLAHAERVAATLVGGGCPPRAAARACLVLDAYVFGFVLQELGLRSPATSTEEAAPDPTRHPTLCVLADAVVADAGFDLGAEFRAGLEVVLDAIGRWGGDR